MGSTEEWDNYRKQFLDRIRSNGLDSPLQCPFCGSNKVCTTFKEERGYWVKCRKCRANGPEKSTNKKAIEAWNNRPQNQKLCESLVNTADNEHPNVGNGYCHWEGCNSPKIAQQALNEVDTE